MKKKPLILIILDGFGHRDSNDGNAIAKAHKPNMDDFLKKFPNTLISGSGKCVGLPEGQMGNSEVGHINIGAGRIIKQELVRIDDEIADGAFFQNTVLTQTILAAKAANKAIHVLGLLSPGGVHSHEKHLHALIKLCSQLEFKNVFIHAFLDGRDTPPQSAMQSLDLMESITKTLGCGKILSIIGRYYAMDRDGRWDRVEKAYHLITDGKAPYQAITAQKALELAYERGETDEFVKPTVICETNEAPIKLEDGDSIIFMNFRADRAREITKALISDNFTEFTRERLVKLNRFVTLTQYDKRLTTLVAYPPTSLTNIFPECIAAHGLRQLRIAETEKYAHVTFFFNGGREEQYDNEDRLLVPSPKVATYDQCPEMSAYALTAQLVSAIGEGNYDVIICNFANPDMVGHTGNFEATVKAIEVIDDCLGKIYQAIENDSGEMIITADHGNAEQMFDYKTNQAHTAHTSDPVPFIYIGRPAKIVNNTGKLSDIAPTMLYLLQIEKPQEMTGNSLVKFT